MLSLKKFFFYSSEVANEGQANKADLMDDGQ